MNKPIALIKLGYHISHEQFPPGELLRLAQKAEDAGFQFCLSSDHFHPWRNEQGQSGFAWSWLGAALATTKMEFGVVNCPCYRYHPAIIAQAAATLDEMFPDRFWVAFGSGQLLNEGITGEHWPAKPERNERLKEAVEVIRKLWKGETVNHHGHVTVEEATLYTRPKTKIAALAAAITPETAGWIAPWADGLITISQSKEKLQEVIDAWKSNGGQNKPMILKVQLSYNESMETATQGAYEQWKSNVFGSAMLADLRVPKQFEQASQHVKPEEMKDFVNISPDLGQHAEWLKEYVEMGFTELVLHNVNTRQEKFIEDFGKTVLPKLI